MLCFFHFIKSDLFSKFVIYKLKSYLPKQKNETRNRNPKQTATCLPAAGKL